MNTPQTHLLDILIVAATVLVGCILLYPPLARSRLWRASITPLASIIGSGFLVLGPILDSSYGAYAPLVMVLLCAGAYLFGAAIRHNIYRLEKTGDVRTPIEDKLETVASWSLAFAYIISVAYYLNLLGAFSVSLTNLNDGYHARLVTTAVFVIILIVGWTQGFGALERMEQISVGMKLSIIAGLLFALTWYFIDNGIAGELVINPVQVSGWQGVTLAAGLLVTVQGFETSRYLGQEYDAGTRIRSMKLAQWISTSIYILYIVLISYVFVPDTFEFNETAIIDVMAVVAPILPILLIAAAIAAQFSAAVADTGGSGGLLNELTRGQLPQRGGYLILVVIGLCLTWLASVFEIISYASRAFALYYALQAMIAAAGTWRSERNRLKTIAYALLGLLGTGIAIFGTAVEG